MIFNSAVIALGGLRLSKFSNTIDLQASRETENVETVEEKIKRVVKNAFSESITVSGFAEVDAEKELIQRLRDNSTTVPFTMASFDDQSLAVFANVKVGRLSWDFEQAKQRKFEAELAPQSEIYVGDVLYSSFKSGLITQATLGPRAELGAFTAGYEAVFTLHVLRPPGVLGTTPQLDGVFETDAAADPWDTPAARIVAAAMTQPGAQMFRLDGDVDPEITDAFWAFNTQVSGTDPSFYVLAAGIVQPKVI